MENILYNELRKRGFNVDVGVIVVNTRDGQEKKVRKQYEIDFVCNKGSQKNYIQSAFAISDRKKLEQEQRPFSYIDDSFKKIIVVKDAPPPWYTEEGILVMSIFDFLLDPDSLKI
jgi:predicted AAA+ superfamily ATPase